MSESLQSGGDSGMSMYAVSLATGHRPNVVTRFMQGRDSQISTCEKMANAIGYGGG
jgi:hypothetical protein